MCRSSDCRQQKSQAVSSTWSVNLPRRRKVICSMASTLKNHGGSDPGGGKCLGSVTVRSGAGRCEPVSTWISGGRDCSCWSSSHDPADSWEPTFVFLGNQCSSSEHAHLIPTGTVRKSSTAMTSSVNGLGVEGAQSERFGCCRPASNPPVPSEWTRLRREEECWA